MQISLTIIFLAVSFMTSIAQAKSEVIYAYGYSSGFCAANDYFCTKSLEDRAVSDAQRDGDFQCWNRKGTLENNPFPYCHSVCNPPNLPNDPLNPKPSYVSCRADCQLNCIIPDAE